ncbi:gp58-like family protein [Solirubrobacter phytolaccae]|uniref:Gp58-like family protein n=1 Tax=Solirubrobacter phytolaccae TaxID=1404360 RepID=A0A9X3NFU8_9ACTN|nr:hypothetical protein [Solirubrobacter phytolaccae]MDA0183281.1 gp58-like family protein [Solirubrobacter phytolaccae]
MRRFVVAAAVAGAALFPASASADNTPAGPATLLNQWRGASTLEGRPPAVLVGAEVQVAAGGQAGTIRIRAAFQGVNAVGDPVQLPAEPGTYRFPAPHIRWDTRGSQLGFDQVTGGHAVVGQSVCDPSLGQWMDPCEIQRVNVFTTSTGEGAPTETLRGARLAITEIYEPDLDEDLVGDTTEDHTDLKVSATPSRDDAGNLRVALRITNAGPLAATVPRLVTDLAGARSDACPKTPASPWPAQWRQCALDRPLAPGETRTVTLTRDSPDAVATTVTVAGDGADLAEADNTVRVAAPAATPLKLETATSPRVDTGVKVRVLGIRDGRTRVTAEFRRAGETVKIGKVIKLKAGQERTVTLKATGAKLRALRRLVGKRPLRASVTAQKLGSKDQAKTRTTIRP